MLDSIAAIDSTAAGQVVVSGSHGGASAAKFMLQLDERPHVVFYNDAGVGKQRAGVMALEMLEAAGVACATYSHESACIGNAQDGYLNGIVTYVNARAVGLRIAPGDRVCEVVQRLIAGSSEA
jgi:hypothetical protein